MLPRARGENLVLQDVGDEVVIYDLERHQAHRLNRTSAIVWRHCDGLTTVADLTVLLQSELNVPIDEHVIWLALDQLGDADLLHDDQARGPDERSLSRRQVIAAGLVGAMSLLLPGCDSITAPADLKARAPSPLTTTGAADRPLTGCFQTFAQCVQRARVCQQPIVTDRANCREQRLAEINECYGGFLACVDRVGGGPAFVDCLERKVPGVQRQLSTLADAFGTRVDACAADPTACRAPPCIAEVRIQTYRSAEKIMLTVAETLVRDCGAFAGT